LANLFFKIISRTILVRVILQVYTIIGSHILKFNW
jgi:hypothetical protein